MQEQTLEYLHKTCAQTSRIAAIIREETDQIIASGDHVEIIKHFDQLRKSVEAIKESRDDMAKLADHLSRVVIPDTFAALKERTGEKPPFQIDGVGRVSVTYRFSCSMTDKQAGMQWLRDNGHEGLIQETVNSSTLGAFARDLLENQGVELPPETFKTSTSPFTSITKK